MARTRPEINASSMADIAFLLLIFFLVTTTMNVDSGIQRILPPIDDSNTDKGIDVKERNILMVHINLNDQVAVAGRKVEINQIKDLAKEFITNPANSPELPEKVAPKDPIPFFPNVLISKGVISLQNDNGTSYDKYLHVQNELTRAFSEARNDLAVSSFGKKYNEITDDQRDAVNKVIRVQISEAEPRNMAGTKR
ncbi:MAG: biopolymer transporter ExbD [Mucinivorans sp.]